jgi:glycosyltransferase involved in cell wall biosynthesis
MKTRVCHLSTAHKGLDVRIFWKECLSLASAGYDTHLVIQANIDEVKRAGQLGVTVHKLVTPRNRLQRIVMKSFECFIEALRIDADIYHFHDVEFIPYGCLLVLLGKTVVYDVHEDVPRDILSKDWIPVNLRHNISKVTGFFECLSANFFFSVVTATPFIAKRVRGKRCESLDINNYPLIGELDGETSWSVKQAEVCYIGGIARIRGIEEVIRAMGKVNSNVRLNLCGEFLEPEILASCRSMEGWNEVIYHGSVDRSKLKDILGRSVAGLVTFMPLPNHMDAMPNKMFEYMSAGIPVIASDFPLWREIVLGNRCGICVDPMDSTGIANAIDYLVNNPEEAQQMGENGRIAVRDRYNWSIEATKLLRFYDKIKICTGF